MSSEFEQYLAVLKASYDYTPQSDDEIEIKEDQILLLVAKTDDDWWKVKVKGESPDEEGLAGLVPAAYVEQAEHTSIVKALYEYVAASSGELTIKEDQKLLAFGKEEGGWLLVQVREGENAGYVPANYVEEISGDVELAAIAAPTTPAAPAMAMTTASDPALPPRSTRPVSVYNDPAELVAATSAKNKVIDTIKTWSVSELDRKGKKKKGTLGIGNGSLFFASEADKTPVQKWQSADVISCKIDKSKHLLIEIAGPLPCSLHYNTGSKDIAEAIYEKLDSSRSLALATVAAADQTPLRVDPSSIRSPSKKGVSVHFSEASPSVIPPREPSESGEEDEVCEETNGHTGADRPFSSDTEGEEAVVLYDFQAQGDDELTVIEGEQLWIIEKDSDEWWKCRNIKGDEGVVPASYIEPSGKAETSPSTDDRAAREAEEKARREREQNERKKQEQERRAKAAAIATETERSRKEKEAREREDKEKEVQVQIESAQRGKEKSTAASSSKSRSDSSGKSSERRKPPPVDKTRLWRDRTGQFSVEAAFLGFIDGKLRLHKVNGVIIEVPSNKMSVEDLRWVDKEMARRAGSSNGSLVDRRSSADDDDQPLALRRSTIQPDTSHRETPTRSNTAPPPKKASTIDWFEFFLNAGCDIDDCTRYASAFERDKIDETVLPDITEGTMRLLGLREGDIIRVQKAIEQRKPKRPKDDTELVRRDEESARQSQESVDDVPKRTGISPAPNLFTGPGGALKTSRRDRPRPSKSTPTTVDINAIATASDQIQRTSTPSSSSPATGRMVSPPARTSSALTVSGFDDDAWTPRPSSIQPTSNVDATATSVPRAPSAPPAMLVATPATSSALTPLAPTSTPTTSATPPAAPLAPISTMQSQQSGSGLAKTTETDIFDQLARLKELRIQQPPISSSPSPAASTSSPAVVSPPPASFNVGLGMGSSPVPIGQLQQQTTGLLSPAPNGPRGPYAPVPANQALLQPLVPTSSNFTGFVPTRMGSSPFQAAPQQPQQQFLAPQPTGIAGNVQPLLPQQTGFQPSAPLMTHATGFVGSGFGSAPPSAVSPLSSFQNSSFGQMQPLQPNPTGFNPGFGQFGNNVSSGPPNATSPTKDTSPANVFAQMKAGTFANDSTPQPSDKYDALRANSTPLTAQPTGWGFPGFPGGYQGYQH